MNRPLSDGAKERIVRSCRATIGDELRGVRYVADGHREWLYVRDDVPIETDPAIGRRDRDRRDECGDDARCVEIVATESDCAVFVGSTADAAWRCDSGSLAGYGEVGAAVTTIFEADRACDPTERPRTHRRG